MTDWSRRAVVAGLVAVAGCGARRTRWPDDPLPDGAPPPEGTPQEVLERLAADTEAGARAVALAALVRAASPDRVLRWSTQGTYDPDPHVQDRVMDALADRGDGIGDAQIAAAWARRSSDGYAISAAAHRLLDRGMAWSQDALSVVWPDERPWDAAPRALVAWREGVTAAGPVIAAALGSGLVRLDPGFLGRLVAHGDPAWAADLRRGADRMEEAAPAYDPVLAAWGDEGARQRWAQALRSSDPFEARAAFDPLASAFAATVDAFAWGRARARSARDPDVRRAAAVVSKPGRGTIARALDPNTPYAARVALAHVDALSPEGQRAALAGALALPDAEGLVDAATTVQRQGIEGLDALLAPLAGHPRATVRAAVAGARLTGSSGSAGESR